MNTLHRIKTGLLRLLILATVLMMLTVSTLLALISTEGGTRLTLNLLRHALDGQLTYGQIHGKLSNKLSIKQIHYAGNDQDIDIDRLQLQWRPLSILRHGITIKQLQLGQVTFTEHAATHASASTPSPAHTPTTPPPHQDGHDDWDGTSPLPGIIDIKRADIDSVTIVQNGQTSTQLKALHLNATINQEQVQINAHTTLIHPTDMSLSLNASGTLKHYTADLTLNNQYTHWHGTATGNASSLKLSTQDATLLNGQLNVDGLIKLTTPTTFNGHLTAQHINLNKLSPQVHGTLDADIQLDGSEQHLFVPKLDVLLKANHAHVSLKGAIREHINVDMAVETVPLERWFAPLQGSLCATGKLSGTLRHPLFQATLNAKHVAWQKLSAPEVKANLKLSYDPRNTSSLAIQLDKGTVSYPLDLTMQQADYQGGTVTGKLTHQGLQLTTALKFIHNSELNGTISLPTVTAPNRVRADAPVSGKLTWHFEDASFLQALIPKVDNFNAKLRSELSIAGTLGNPRLTGIAKLEQGQFTVSEIQTNAKDLTLEAHAVGHKLEFTGKTQVGAGSLDLTGHTDFSNLNLNTHLAVRGHNAQLINTPATKITASPNVTIDLNAEGLQVKGHIDIPKGAIQTYEFGETESLPDDVVIIDPRQGLQDDSGFDISSLVDITLGDDIFINMDGLKGRVTGKLSIQDEPNKPTTAAGQLQILDGTFQLYGVKFIIDQGKLSYHGGPISNPGLNIRAIRKIKVTSSDTNQLGREDLIVGVIISGSVNNQKYTLFSSNGSYSQGDILSYLFTGQPLGDLQGDGDNTKRILQAAAFGSNNLRNEIKNKLGLTDLDIETSTEIDKRANRTIQHTALVLGKYLSPKLYIRYSFDVLDHTNKLNIKYYLNKNWAIQTESSNSSNSSNLDNGVDVLYTIERN